MNISGIYFGENFGYADYNYLNYASRNNSNSIFPLVKDGGPVEAVLSTVPWSVSSAGNNSINTSMTESNTDTSNLSVPPRGIYNEAALRNSIISVARKELSKNVTENLGVNDSIDIRRYKKMSLRRSNNWDWCAYFASYCVEKALGGKMPFKYNGRSQEIRTAAQNAGYFGQRGKYTPKVGDLAIWTKKGSSCQGHIGIVSKVYSDGSYDVIEGNSVNDKLEEIHYKSQNDANSRYATKYFAGFVKTVDWAMNK